MKSLRQNISALIVGLKKGFSKWFNRTILVSCVLALMAVISIPNEPIYTRFFGLSFLCFTLSIVFYLGDI